MVLSAGFVFVDDQLKFCAWASAEMDGYSFFAEPYAGGTQVFGAGTAFLETDADEADAFQAPLQCGFSGMTRLFCAAEKSGPYEGIEDSQPWFTATRQGNPPPSDPRLGKLVGSLLPHHTAFLSPINQNPFYFPGVSVAIAGPASAAYLPWIDCGGHIELGPTSGGFVGATGQSNALGPAFFLNTSAAYPKWNKASWPITNAASNVSHVPSVNERLKKIRVLVDNFDTNFNGIVPFTIFECDHIEGTLNEYTGVGFVGEWTVRALISVFRNDYLTAGTLPFQFSDLSHQTWLFIRASICVHKGAWPSSTGGTSTKTCLDGEAATFFNGGQLSIEFGGSGYRSLSGAIRVQAIGTA
jgi:hypothetical protein